MLFHWYLVPRLFDTKRITLHLSGAGRNTSCVETQNLMNFEALGWKVIWGKGRQYENFAQGVTIYAYDRPCVY